MLEMQDKLQEELETVGLNSGSYPALPGIIDDPSATSQKFVGGINWKGGSGGDCKSMDKSDDEDSVGGGSGGDDDDEDDNEEEEEEEEEELRVCMFPSGVGVVRTVFRPNADGRFATAVPSSQSSTAQQQPPSGVQQESRIWVVRSKPLPLVSRGSRIAFRRQSISVACSSGISWYGSTGRNCPA